MDSPPLNDEPLQNGTTTTTTNGTANGTDVEADAEPETEVRTPLDASFETLDELNRFLNDYQTQKNVQLNRKVARTITGARRRGLALNARDDLVYSEMLYTCAHYGLHTPRGSSRSSPGSGRQECPFFMKLRLSSDGQKLNVIGCSEEHNHPQDEKPDDHVFRRLHGQSLTKDYVEIREKVVGFIGAGNMAQALGKGFVKSGNVFRKNVYFSAPSNKNLNNIKKKGHETTHDNLKILEQCSVVIVAVKPHLAKKVLREMADYFDKNEAKNTLVISIMGGITLQQLQEQLPGVKVIRAMPNTPAQVCSGVTVYSRGTLADEADGRLARRLFSAVGHCEEIQEHLINAVTGLTGSGPAFVYLMMQAMSDGAVKMGLSRSVATLFAAHTFMGAARTVTTTGKHPSVLQDEVASPGGTTIHGLHKLEAGNVRSSIIDAVQAATERAAYLAK